MKLHRKRPVVDALSPLDALTHALLRICIAVLAIWAVGVAVNGWTIFEINEPSICVDAGFTLPHGDDASDLVRDDFGLAAGTTALEGDARVCQDDPSVGQRVLTGFMNVPTFALFVGFLALVQRLIRQARRDGLFSRALAAGVERLGWLLLVGLVTCAAVEWLADGLLRSTMYDASWSSGSFHLSVAGLIGGYGIVSIGRVMARAADLQDDVEGTV